MEKIKKIKKEKRKKGPLLTLEGFERLIMGLKTV